MPAQLACRGITLAVRELVEFDGDHGEVVYIVLDRLCTFFGSQPDAERPAVFIFAVYQFGTARLPYR